MLSYYRNSGTLTVPDFSVVTNRFGNMKPIDSIGFQYTYDDTFAITGRYTVYEKFTFSKPQVSDLNGDGILEIIVGNSLGTLRIYELGSSPTSTFKQLDSVTYQNGLQGRKFYHIDLGSYISPCLADLDGDTVPEILIASNRGGIRYMKEGFSYKHKVSIADVKYSSINGYPNPTSKAIEFNLDAGDVSSIDVYNSLGQVVPVKYNTDGQITVIDVDNLVSGFYIVNIRMNNAQVYTSKFQVLKTY